MPGLLEHPSTKRFKPLLQGGFILWVCRWQAVKGLRQLFNNCCLASSHTQGPSGLQNSTIYI